MKFHISMRCNTWQFGTHYCTRVGIDVSHCYHNWCLIFYPMAAQVPRELYSKYIFLLPHYYTEETQREVLVCVL